MYRNFGVDSIFDHADFAKLYTFTLPVAEPAGITEFFLIFLWALCERFNGLI